MPAENRRVLSGIQPTGRLHLGNYLGAIRNWVALQDQGYECFYCVVDLHALTTVTDARTMAAATRDMALDLLGAGVDPERSTLFVQSHVPEVTELSWILGTLTGVGKLQRVPTYKEKAAQHPDNVNLGLLSYPVLQAADIVIYEAGNVPVGEDQLPHLELTREIVRSFNQVYGPTLVEPKAILTETPRVPGLGGEQKMSKSLGNQLDVFAEPDEVRRRVRLAVTDVGRPRRTDPGHPENCNVCQLHRLLTPGWAAVWEGERSAATGCADTKARLAEELIEHFAPMRERRLRLESDPARLQEILAEGAERARSAARATLERVRDCVGLVPPPPRA